MQFVAAATEAFDDLLASPARDEIDVRDRVRVAHADNTDIAFTNLASALSFTRNSDAGIYLGPITRTEWSYCS
jgi:hypothetical protein